MRTLVLILLLAGAAWAGDPPNAEALKHQVVEWTPVDYAAFGQLIEKAKAAGVEEIDTLLPRLEASLLFADVEKLKELLPQAEKAQAEIVKHLPTHAEAKEDVARSLKLCKQFLALVEKRPTEAPRRAEIFRMYYYAQTTLEDSRLLDAALDQCAVEKKLPEGADVTFEQLRGYLKKDTQLYDTGATVFGDKFGPLKVGFPPAIPSETFNKLKPYLPADAWGVYAPK